MKSVHLIVAISLLLSVASCKHNEPLPEGVLDESRFAALLTDLYLAEGYFAITSDFQYKDLGSDMAATYDTLLAEHQVTPEELDLSTTYYLQHRDKYKRVYERVMDNLDQAR